MLRKRYRTIHETRDANARMISMLCTHPISRGLPRVLGTSYSVVAFMVNVRLVENKANRKVGSVIVKKVMIQTNVWGKALAMERRP